MPIRWKGRVAEVTADNGTTLHRTTATDKFGAMRQLRSLLKALMGSLDKDGEIQVQEGRVREKKTDRLYTAEPSKR